MASILIIVFIIAVIIAYYIDYKKSNQEKYKWLYILVIASFILVLIVKLIKLIKS